MPLNECQEQISDSKIKVEERGRKATFQNPLRQVYVKTKFDGCVVAQATAADWVLSKQEAGDVVIELKGKNVEQGVKQIFATAKFWTDNGYRVGQIAGLLVCSQFPKVSTVVQRAKQHFSRSYSGPLHVVSHNSEYVFERVLSYDGPHGG